MLNNAIFSGSHENSSSLHDERGEILVGLNGCLAITKRLAEKSPNLNFQKGSDCLSAMCSEIEEIDSKPMSRQAFSR